MATDAPPRAASDTAALVAALPLPETIANPYPLYEKLRPLTPVYGYRDYPPGTVPDADEPVTAWVLMSYADVTAAAKDHETFSSRDPLQEGSSAPTLMLVNHDNPEHDRLRAIVNVVFSRRQVVELRDWVMNLVDELLDALPGTDVEVVQSLTAVIPARVMLRYLGLPDSDHERFRRWATAFMLSADLTPEEREASNQELAAYFVEKVSEAQAAAEAGEADDLIADLLRAEVDGQRLTFEEVVRFCITLVVAGSETTTFLLTNLLHNLAIMPELRERLATDRSLMKPFVDESLRHGGPPQRLFRIATRDIEIAGQRIREGDWVAVFFGAANHDPAVFPHPERFDITRTNLAQQLSFGHGIHHCLGSALARLEAECLMNAVLDRYSDVAIGAAPPVPQTTSLLTHSLEALSLRFTPRRQAS